MLVGCRDINAKVATSALGFSIAMKTWDFGTSNCSTGFGQVYDSWELGPIGLTTIFKFDPIRS